MHNSIQSFIHNSDIDCYNRVWVERNEVEFRDKLLTRVSIFESKFFQSALGEPK